MTGASDDRTRADFDVAPTLSVVVGDDLDACRLPVKMMMALYIGGMGARDKNFYNRYTREMGYEAAAIEIQDLFLSGRKEEAVQAVPDALVDEVALIGPLGRIRERASRMASPGCRGQGGYADTRHAAAGASGCNCRDPAWMMLHRSNRLAGITGPVVTVVLDGVGQRSAHVGNAVANACTPTLDRLFARYPHILLKAHGTCRGNAGR